jgi:hypothetical protein
MHGGTPGSGRPITHGRYSRVLGKLREPYERARHNRELLTLEPGLALLDVRLEALLERLEDGDETVWPNTSTSSSGARSAPRLCGASS